MNTLERKEKIKKLKEELHELLLEDAKENCKEFEAIEQICITMVKHGKYIDAVKYYKDNTKLGLKDSKSMIDKLKIKYGL